MNCRHYSSIADKDVNNSSNVFNLKTNWTDFFCRFHLSGAANQSQLDIFCRPSKEAFPSPNKWRSRLLSTRYAVVNNFVALYFIYLSWLAGYKGYVEAVKQKKLFDVDRLPIFTIVRRRLHLHQRWQMEPTQIEHCSQCSKDRQLVSRDRPW